MDKAKFDEIVQSTSSSEWIDIMIESDQRGKEWMQSADQKFRALAIAIKSEQILIHQAIKAKEATLQIMPA
jgi:hypothetical protein